MKLFNIKMTICSKQNFLHFILLYQFIIVKCKDLSNNNAPQQFGNEAGPSMELSNVRMKIVTESNNHEFLNLRRTNQILANKHLPVWIVNGVVDEESLNNNCGNELKLDEEVMNRVGEFTMYHDPETTAAAVYFHRRRQFDGIIDYRYLIQGLNINLIDATSVTEFKVGEHTIVVREKSLEHSTQVKFKSEDEKMGKAQENENQKTTENKVNLNLNHGYPEILVIVSCELAQKLMITESKSERYTAIVSYILTLFNGVDMLYSKLKKPKIELNIAGIIIEEHCESLAFLKKCQNKMNSKENPESMLNADCTLKLLEKYFSSCKETISSDSYDVVVHLTRRELYSINKEDENSAQYNEIEYIQGLAAACENIYESRKGGNTVVLPATVHDRGDFGTYGVIAHEVAHLMTVIHDDSLFHHSVKNGECSMNIMKDGDGQYWCKNCLSWSDASRNNLKIFFSSPNCCTFMNKPRSLYAPGPRQILTADEQCLCYGYKSAMAFRMKTLRNCKSHIICRDETASFVDAPIPMDGTLCDPNKVCWNKECLPSIEE